MNLFHSAKQIANSWILHSAAAVACAKQKKKYDTSMDDHNRWLVHGLFNSKQWRGWADRQDCGVKCIQKQYDEMAIAAVKLGTPGSTRDWLRCCWEPPIGGGLYMAVPCD